MSTRIHPHSPLPAPAMRASTPSVQSKSHVLAGVQDAYWSEDETEDTECPLCLEEMDISDINFKPCPCGYQICRFCWHHIKENLNRRCPACRREYSDEAVQFKPINKEDHKRLTQQKKQKERERKDLEALGRRQLANVRVVQRNVVYVVGIGQKFAKEELIPTLRTHEYFGQYGKISKIVITKRTASGGRAPVVGLYITFHRREDAARCIAAVDGAPSPSGGGEVMRASYGTTKYCMAFLRGVSCSDHSCLNLHEWGDENDCFTKEDLTTLKHTMKDTETRARKITVVKKGDESEGLPRAASWANKGLNSVASTALHNSASNSIQPAISRQTRRPPTSTRAQRTTSSTAVSTSSFPALREKRATTSANKTPSVDSSSRPATPARAPTPQRADSPTVSSKPVTKSKDRPVSPPPRSASPIDAAPEDVVSGNKEPTPPTSPPDSALPSPVPVPAPAAPPGLPAVPPGLSAPPGLPPPTRLSASVESSPQIQTQGPYQMSTQAQALFEDIKARRELTQVATGPSPFPDLDRMLQSLQEDSGFSFSLDPKLAGNGSDSELNLPDLDVATDVAFSGSFFDAFPSVRHVPPPGLGYPPQLDIQTSSRSPAPSTSSSYTGSFNPFATDGNDEGSRQYSPLDDDRKVSRFGFARGRQGSSSMSNAASPIHLPSSLSLGEHSSQASYFGQQEMLSSANHSNPAQWNNYTNRHHGHEYLHQPSSAMSSPLAQHAQAYTPYSNQFQQQQQQLAARQQQYDTTVSEAQLRELINSSRDRSMRSGSADSQQFKFTTNQPFNDPAIMSARLASPVISQQMHDNGYPNMASTPGGYPSQQHASFGPPPGLSFPPGVIPSPSLTGRQGLAMAGGLHSSLDVSQAGGATQVSNPTSPVPSPALSSTDFPALAATDVPSAENQPQPSSDPSTPSTPALDPKAQAKAERLAAKKAAAEERAAARRKLAEEKAVARAAEKEKAAALKAEKERIAKEKAEEQAAQEKAAKEKLEKQRLERERVEKEKAKEREEKEKAQLEARKAASAVKATKQATQTKTTARAESETFTATQSRTPQPSKSSVAKTSPVEPAAQAPILARMPKKNKPVTRPIKIPKEDIHDNLSALASAATSDAPQLPDSRGDSGSRSRSESVDRNEPMSLEDLFAEIDLQVPWMRLAQHPFFDMAKINPAAKMPLEYGPLVHALSALSVGGGSFADNMPSGSIDHAVSSFQQLLETLTQTISDLLRLLPRTTWDDSSSFDGVLRDMLRGDDFLEEGDEEQNKQAKEDEVTALTLALERRARWMEVQLSKLEELHRDINTAAVRAVLSFNDNGWDPHGFMPRMGNTLQKFDQIGMITENGVTREMTADELEKKLVVAKEHAVFAETELRETMQRLQSVRPYDDEEY